MNEPQLSLYGEIVECAYLWAAPGVTIRGNAPGAIIGDSWASYLAAAIWLCPALVRPIAIRVSVIWEACCDFCRDVQPAGERWRLRRSVGGSYVPVCPDCDESLHGQP